MTAKLTAKQTEALTFVAAQMDRGLSGVTPDRFPTVTWTSLEKRDLVTLTRVHKSIVNVTITDAGRAAITEPGEEGAALEDWSTVQPDGSVLMLADMSDQQAEALTDIHTVGWTPAARRTVESLIRHGLITWVPETSDPAEFKLTAEGARAYAAISTYTLVPNRRDRRRITVTPITSRTRKPGRKVPSTRAVRSLIVGERFLDRLGRPVTVAAAPEKTSDGLSVLVLTDDGERVQAEFTQRKARVTMSDTSPRVRLARNYRDLSARPGVLVIHGETLRPTPYEEISAEVGLAHHRHPLCFPIVTA